MHLRLQIITLLCIIFCHNSIGQDREAISSINYNKLSQSIAEKNKKFQTEIDRTQQKFIQKLKKREQKILSRLKKADSSITLPDIEEEFAKLKAGIDSKPASIFKQAYNGYLDSVTTIFRFLENKEFISGGKIDGIIPDLDLVQQELNYLNSFNQLLNSRQKQIHQLLERFGQGKKIKKLQQDIFVYKNRIAEIKSAWQNPALIENIAVEFISKIPEFKNFFASESVIGRLFPSPSLNAGAINIPGLQNRANLNSTLTNRFGSERNVAAAVSNSLGSSQDMLDKLKDKVSGVINSGGDLEMPDFKPDMEKGKSFWKRLELGTNLQTTKSTSFYPSTANIGLSIGYKISEKSIVGLGTSYKLGMGTGIQNIVFSHEGIGLRSFLDIKLKGSFFMSGGFEYNYHKPFESFRTLEDISYWQQSGLIGLSKIVSLKSKTFKKTKLQLLWDFLSYDQKPQQQNFIIRVGYFL